VINPFRRERTRPPVVTRYVRKPKVTGRTTYATRAMPESRHAYRGRHAAGIATLPLHRLKLRLSAERTLRAARYQLSARHGVRRAPAGVATMVRRAHRVARAKVPARGRVSDLTGHIPRRIAYHGARVKLSLRNSVRDGAWVMT
jgi:hypothetical protein